MKRKSVEINASSMADIAFLLLVFFLVTTKIDTDKGILVQLPSIENQDSRAVPDREAFLVQLNSKDELLVEHESYTIENLKQYAKRHLTNEGKEENLSSSPLRAVIELTGNRGSSYGMYLSIYNELRAAYREVRHEYALQQFQKSLKDLTQEEAAAVRKKYPMRLCEATPISTFE